MLWYAADVMEFAEDAILAVGELAVQNGYHHVATSNISDSMYYAKGPRTRERPSPHLTLRVSDHEPAYDISKKGVNIVLLAPGNLEFFITKEQPGLYYAERGDDASVQEAFLKADAEIERRIERMNQSRGKAVASWIRGNCRFAAIENVLEKPPLSPMPGSKTRKDIRSGTGLPPGADKWPPERVEREESITRSKIDVLQDWIIENLDALRPDPAQYKAFQDLLARYQRRLKALGKIKEAA